MKKTTGFRVQGSGFRPQGSGFRPQGSGFRVQWVILSLFFIFCTLYPVPCTLTAAFANPEIVTFSSPVVWRGDGQGDYLFKDNGKLSGVKINSDGAVEYVSAPGTYELTSAHPADGLIINLCMSWESKGNVTMQVSATGYAADYVPVANGVPVDIKAGFGNNIKWRATLAAGSALSQARLTYKDVTGLSGSFGNPKLSGFNFKKPIFIRVQGTGDRVQEDLFNFQVPITIGESVKAKDCDATVKGVVQADFDDARFTSADGETPLPYYIESVSGSAGQRVAKFWVKVPQIPKDGIIIYLYYGKFAPEILSSGLATFEFFDDFSSAAFDEKKWDAYDFSSGVIEYKQGSGDRVQGTGGEIQTLDTTQMTKEQIISFFKTGKGFQWARVREYADSMPAVDAAKTAQLAEEIPNLPNFENTAVSANGDLALAAGALSGVYTSRAIFSDYSARIMVPSWKPAVAVSGDLRPSISADNTIYKEGVVSDNYYYASKGDFTAGKILRWRVQLSRLNSSSAGPYLNKFSLDFRPGAISVVAPAAKEGVEAGSAYNISWSALEYEPSYRVKLGYSPDSGKTYTTIVDKVLNSGRYAWTTPEELTATGLIRVTDALDEHTYGESGIFRVQGSGDRVQGAAQPAAEESVSSDKSAEEAAMEKEIQADIKKDKATAEGRKLYELLIKKGDNPSPNGYKEGDIVMIKPAGYLWGAEERSKFLIVQAYLTDKEAKYMMMPKESVAGFPGARRKYKVDFKKHKLEHQVKPAVEVTAVEEK